MVKVMILVMALVIVMMMMMMVITNIMRKMVIQVNLDMTDHCTTDLCI